MKRDLEKVKKVTVVQRTQVSSEKVDMTYQQVNRVSFQQNFKVLIGHYTNEPQTSRTPATEL